MRRAAAQPVTPRARDAQPGGVGLTGVSTGGGACRGNQCELPAQAVPVRGTDPRGGNTAGRARSPGPAGTRTPGCLSGPGDPPRQPRSGGDHRLLAGPLCVARTTQFRPQLAQFPPQLFELLAEVGFVASVRLAFAPTRVALGMLAHQLLGPLTGFVSQIREAGRFEMPGGHLQVLGSLLGWQIALGTGSLRSTPLRTRSPEIGTLLTGTLRATGAFVRTAGTVRTIPQLLQPAFGFVDGSLHLREFRWRSLTLDQFTLPDAQFIEMSFDLLPFAVTHLLHPPPRSHPFGTVSRATIPRTAIPWPSIIGTTIARAPILRTAPLGPPVLHAASFPRTTIAWTAITWTAITWARVTRATLTRTTIARAALRTASVVNQLLLGGQLGLRPNPPGITRWILRQASQQTNSQSQPQIPRHARSSR